MRSAATLAAFIALTDASFLAVVPVQRNPSRCTARAGVRAALEGNKAALYAFGTNIGRQLKDLTCAFLLLFPCNGHPTRSFTCTQAILLPPGASLRQS